MPGKLWTNLEGGCLGEFAVTRRSKTVFGWNECNGREVGGEGGIDATVNSE